MSADFLAIGHVARDEFEGEATWRLGGTALYAAATAARLGTATALVTRVGPKEKAALEARCAELGIMLHALPSSVTTTFAFRYVEGRRFLRLKARARGIAPSDIPAEWRAARAVVLGSVAHELDRSLFGTTSSAANVLVAQGYLREWAADGAIQPRAWEDAEEIVPLVSGVVISEDDVAGDLSAPRRWARNGCVYVTLAERGVLVLDRGSETTIAGYPAERVVDPTGAGDALVATLTAALTRRRPLETAASLAVAAAAATTGHAGGRPHLSRAELDRLQPRELETVQA